MFPGNGRSRSVPAMGEFSFRITANGMTQINMLFTFLIRKCYQRCVFINLASVAETIVMIVVAVIVTTLGKMLIMVIVILTMLVTLAELETGIVMTIQKHLPAESGIV